jgi:ABC-2 type transport system ATP-binding protein
MAERLELDTSVRIRKLSRGNRQKIGVVAAFTGDAPLLVLDEPTTGLDPLMQREFLALVSEVRAAGRTVFLSSHNLVEVERACDRVGIIRDGRLADIQAVTELLGEHIRSINLLLASPAPDAAFELPNVEVVARTGREVHLMIRGDINPLLERIATLDVADISITTPDIEDIFLRHYHPATAAEAVR